MFNGKIEDDALFEKMKRFKKNVFYFKEIMDATDFALQTLKEGDLFITIGAGDNWQLGKALVEKIKEVKS